MRIRSRGGSPSDKTDIAMDVDLGVEAFADVSTADYKSDSSGKKLEKRTPFGSVSSVVYLCRAALIAALYVVLTLVSYYIGLTSYVVQLRLSEALCILPFFTPAAVPGLAIGCVIANLITGSAPWDIALGSCATLIGAIAARIVSVRLINKGRKKAALWLSPIPNIIANTIILPPVISWLYGTELTMPILVIAVFGGELLSCGVLGIPLAYALSKRGGRLFH